MPSLGSSIKCGRSARSQSGCGIMSLSREATYSAGPPGSSSASANT